MTTICPYKFLKTLGVFWSSGYGNFKKLNGTYTVSCAMYPLDSGATIYN